jgi:hypothetical protein
VRPGFFSSRSIAADVDYGLPPEEPDWAGLLLGLEVDASRACIDGKLDLPNDKVGVGEYEWLASAKVRDGRLVGGGAELKVPPRTSIRLSTISYPYTLRQFNQTLPVDWAIICANNHRLAGEAGKMTQVQPSVQQRCGSIPALQMRCYSKVKCMHTSEGG